MRADARFVLFPQFLERKFNDMSEEIEIKDEVLDLVKSRDFDVLVILGAGDLDNYVPQIAKIIEARDEAKA